MKIYLSKINLSLVTLLLTFVMVSFFSFWLFSESEDDKLIRLILKYDDLRSSGKYKESAALLANEITSETNEPLDPIWIQVVQKTDGFVRLELYERLLRFDANQEDIYSAVAKLLEMLPSDFQEEIKTVYISNLMKIPNIRKDYLKKYHLTLSEVEK